MISWLLVAVLLFADNAITTPTSTSSTRPTSTIAAVANSELVIENHHTGDSRGSKGRSSNSGGGYGGSLSSFQVVPMNGDLNNTEGSTANSRDHGFSSASDRYANSSILAERLSAPMAGFVTTSDADNSRGEISGAEMPSQINNNELAGSRSNLLKQDSEIHKSIATQSTSSDHGTNLAHSEEANHQFVQQPQANTSKTSSGKYQEKKIYTNQFVIKVEGGEDEARRLAEKHGFIYLNHILGDYYHLEHRRLAKRSANIFDMANLDTSIEEEPHVLTFERQVLKRRVKRDFIDLGNPPPINNGLGRGAQQPSHHHHQQQQQLSSSHGDQQRQPIQMLRPAARPSQYLRPPNQVPANQLGSFNYQQQLHGSQMAGGSMQYNDNRRLGPSQSPGRHEHNQQLLDQLEVNSSGPIPFFLHANFSNVKPTSGANINKHRPPPSPIQMSASSSEIQRGNKTLHYTNDTLSRQAPFNDPSWPLMWYLDGGARNGFDLNVQAAWKMGYTGRGIVITILDDGLEKDHPDLQANYDPLASFDINGDDADPMPRYDSSDSNRHGTRCAGEVAAVPNNNICSIGIAYNSKVGGVRMLDGEVTDAVEARSLSLNNQHIHIYSASWGPDDNGKTVDGPGELATRAFIEGVTYGRGGLGSIFVFASGNGGREHDNCNCDGYTNSIWTLSISSASENGFVPWYIEACSSTLATTYSSGSFDERQIATTDIRHSCTNNHTGTSASAPIAAGICALVLEANPELSWRDMQHIVVRTAKPANLMAKDWRTNAIGRNVSHAFGYGLMDAAAMIVMAKQWRTMPKQYSCMVEAGKMEHHIPSKQYIALKLSANCAKIRFIEHVQSLITLTATRRGDIHIYLISPHGTRSTLLAQRPMDVAEQGFRNWPFMTVHSWGESPNGNWTLEVHNDGKLQNRAILREWNLTLYGTYDDPNRHLDAVNAGPTGSAMAATPTTTTTTTTSTTTTPAPRELNRQQQHSMNNQPPPPPSFSPTDYDVSIGRPTNRKPSMGSSGHASLPSMSPSLSTPPPPPPPISNKVPPVIQDAALADTVATSAKQQHNLPAQTVATTSTTSTTTTTTTVASVSEVQYESDSKQQQANEMQLPKAHKADFDVVAPPTGTGSTHQQQHQSGGFGSGGQTSDPFLLNSRPHVQVIDSNKIDSSQPTEANSTMAESRPASGRQQQQQHQSNEFDANQLDSKMTKDYRSSGGGHHDVSTPSYDDDMATRQSQSSADLALTGKSGASTKHRQKAASSSSQSVSLHAGHYWCLLLACWLVLGLQLSWNQPTLVRVRACRS